MHATVFMRSVGKTWIPLTSAVQKWRYNILDMCVEKQGAGSGAVVLSSSPHTCPQMWAAANQVPSPRKDHSWKLMSWSGQKNEPFVNIRKD